MDTKITTTARRIARKINKYVDEGGDRYYGYCVFDSEGHGGKWHSSSEKRTATNPGEIAVQVTRYNLTAGDIQNHMNYLQLASQTRSM